MRLVNGIFIDFIGKFVFVYLDDIIIFSHSREEHLSHVEQVLRTKLVFLGFVISQGTLKMDPEKVETIINWSPPKNQGDLSSFHGFATFYRKFINNFSHVCAPMLDTIKGGRKC